MVSAVIVNLLRRTLWIFCIVTLIDLTAKVDTTCEVDHVCKVPVPFGDVCFVAFGRRCFVSFGRRCFVAFGGRSRVLYIDVSKSCG